VGRTCWRHDLGTDALLVLLGEGVVHSGASASAPEASGEHPLVEPLAGVAEGRFGGLWLSCGEAVEGDGQVVDPGE
jgi:hypothetical protein